ncbi:helix-turn-helix domain-containing protein [Cohnella thermotolerans]|uniref:helix-turn-helix domain-containing protein n=1 Tax=Cohnella thermotolerans TaxID=329858 RepID=UPI0003FDA3B8|nr:hypothetical protein [Cohnella thermotolerans]
MKRTVPSSPRPAWNEAGSIACTYRRRDKSASTAFTNASYFYRMFKKHYGQTPTDFRKNCASPEPTRTSV